VTVERAEVSFVVLEIELGAGRHVRREDFRIDGEVEHGEVTPVRGQKRLQHRWRGTGVRDQRSEDRISDPSGGIFMGENRFVFSLVRAERLVA
jgi:hypothetical protein